MVSKPNNNEVLESWQQVRAPYNVGYRIKLLSQLIYRKFSERLEVFGLTPFHTGCAVLFVVRGWFNNQQYW